MVDWGVPFSGLIFHPGTHGSSGSCGGGCSMRKSCGVGRIYPVWLRHPNLLLLRGAAQSKADFSDWNAKAACLLARAGCYFGGSVECGQPHCMQQSAKQKETNVYYRSDTHTAVFCDRAKSHGPVWFLVGQLVGAVATMRCSIVFAIGKAAEQEADPSCCLF